MIKFNAHLGLVAALVLFLVTGCALSPETEAAVKAGIAVNAGHEKDAGLSGPAKAIAQDNRDLLWSILYNEGSVKEVPEDVRARWEARKKAKGGDK